MPDERKTVTVLFADLVDSTVIGSQNDPEVVRAVMARYFARLSEVAELHGGSVEKFIGDAVMVVFGVPRVHEDDAERAVRAALLMREAVADLGPEVSVDLAVRIAVNTGEAVAGAGEERQFLVTGDAVNVAARLQQNADPGDVIVGAATERLTRRAIEYEPLEPIAVKGKAEPIAAYRVIRARSLRPEQHRGMPALRAALVGRERELGMLVDAFERSAEERTGTVATVLGNAGVGKSRLVGEALARISGGSGTRVLKGRCLPYGAGITYWPLMDLVRADADIDSSDDGAMARGKLARRIGQLLEGDLRDAVQARISVLLGLETVAAGLPGLAPERIGIELSWGVRQLLEAVAEQGPVVLVIDDLQWAAPAVIEVLSELNDEAAGVPFLLVCVARPELMERHPSWFTGRPNASVIALEPLSAADTKTLLSRLLSIEKLPAFIESEVVERSAGNPLFCEELLSMLIADGTLDVASGEWRATGPASGIGLPETIHAIVAARIDGLPPEEKHVLQTASVIGERFAVDELLALLGSAGAAPESLVRKGVFERDREDRSRRTLRFKHLLLRDVAYDSVPKLDRATLHDRYAAHLEGEMSERLDEFSELLAYHSVQSHAFSEELRLEAALPARAERALRWSRAAADRSFALYATEQAAAHYATAIRIARNLDADSDLLRELYTRGGRSLELHGDYARAIATYEAMAAHAVERADERMRAEALVHQGTLYATPTPYCDPDRGDLLLEDALEIARSLEDPALIAQVQRDRIHIELWRGRLERGLEVGEASIAAARELESPNELAFTLNTMGCAYREAGLIERGIEALVEAREIFAGQDNKPMMGNVLSQHAGLEFVRGDYAAALELCAEAQRLTEEAGNLWGQAFSRCNALWVHFERGDMGQAIQVGEEGVRLAEASGPSTLLSFYRADLSLCYRYAGADDLADDHLKAAHSYTESHLPHWRAATLAHLSRAATTRGELAEAAEHLELARPLLAERTEFYAFQHAQVGLAAIELLLASGRHADAAAEARVYGDAQRQLMRPYVADFEYLEGEAHRLGGNAVEARDALDRAARTALELGCGRLSWRIGASRANLEESLGNTSAAVAARDEARRLLAPVIESLRPVGLADGFQALAEVAALSRAETPLARN